MRQDRDDKLPGNYLARPVPVASRWLAATIAALLWGAATILIEALSFVHSLVVVADPWPWRLGLGLPAVLVFAGLIRLARRPNLVVETTFQRALLVVWLLAAGVNFVVILLSPATFAVLINLIGTSFAAGLFFRARVLAAQMALLAALIAAPLALHLTDHLPSAMAAWLVVYGPVVLMVVVVAARSRARITRAMEDAERAANTDPLTGLANRRALENVVDAALDGTREAGLLLLDLDDFKLANTLYGHPGGDHALIVVASALLQSAPADHLVARVGGDEVAVFAPDASPAALDTLASVYLEAVRSANEHLGLPGVTLGASIGIAASPRNGKSLAELLVVADNSMYAQKAAGRAFRPRRRPHSRHARQPAIGVHPTRQNAVPASDCRAPRADTRARPAHPVAVATGLIATACALVLSRLLNPSGAGHMHLLVATCAAIAVLAVAVAALRPSDRVLTHPLVDLLLAVVTMLIVRLTGGFESPAIVLVFLTVGSSQVMALPARGLPKHLTRAAPKEVRRLIGGASVRWVLLPELVLLSPFLYTGLSKASAPVTAALLVAAVPTLACISVAVFTSLMVSAWIEERSLIDATTDPLTGVMNRRAFIRDLQLRIADPVAEQFAVVLLDLDNFAEVNNAYGHVAGDAFLRDVAVALSKVAQGTDLVARIGGDEFAVIIPLADAPSAHTRGERYVRAVVHLAAADVATQVVTASAGCALYPTHGETVDELIGRADDALMSVKESIKGGIQLGLVANG